jgi:hypothetical protein
MEDPHILMVIITKEDIVAVINEVEELLRPFYFIHWIISPIVLRGIMMMGLFLLPLVLKGDLSDSFVVHHSQQFLVIT